MTEAELKRKAAKLKSLVDNINTLMAELDDAGVEVRINYVEPKRTGDTPIKQGIHLWRLTKHTDLL